MRRFIFFLTALLIVPDLGGADVFRGITLIPSNEATSDKPDSVVPIDAGGSAETETLTPSYSDPTGASKVAFVIGNSSYDHVPKIKNPVNDAVAIKAMLEGIGFTVWTGIDLDLDETLSIIRDFVARTREAEVVLFYYGGHAIEVSGRNFIVPTDADIRESSDFDRELIPLDQVMGLLEQNGQTVIVLLDACRDNPFAVSKTRQIEPISQGLAPISAGAGTMITYATAPGNVAFDGTGNNSPFAKAVLDHMPTAGLPIEIAMVRIRRSIAESTDFRQLPWTHSSLLEEVVLVPGKYSPSLSIAQSDGTPSFDPDLTSFFAEANSIAVENTKIYLADLSDQSEREARIWGAFQEGVNYVEAGGRSIKVWVEANSAFIISTDYSESHAVIVAIDEYPRSSGQRPLGFMERHAQLLSQQLARMGIPQENITELYGPQATKEAIEGALEPFWGVENSGETDRLIVYFGGHGTSLTRTGQDRDVGILLPYDYDPERPLKSGIWLEEMRSRSFDYSIAHHTLILIDACASGLALPGLMNSDTANGTPRLSAKQRWQRIRADMEGRHRAMIVAGTEDEDVLWLNGGLFTKTLLEALGGQADKNQDGLIRFDELVLHLRSVVFERAVALGHKQRPVEWSQGDGRIMFEQSRLK